MQLFILKSLKNNRFQFYDNDINHILKVLRKKCGDQINAIDQQNKIYILEIVGIEPFTTKLVETINQNNEYDLKINLFVGVVKKINFEWLIEKATEMHVNNIYPIYFNRTQKSNIINLKRLQTIIDEARKQSNRHYVVTIHEPIDFSSMLNMLNNDQLKIIAYENEKNYSFNDVQIKNHNIVNLVVGSEGGFEIKEIEQLLKLKNSFSIKLTKSILRTETACLFLLACTINRWGK